MAWLGKAWQGMARLGMARQGNRNGKKMKGGKMKILKIKIGEVFINGKAESVFIKASQKTSKKGEVYYEIRQPIFVQNISDKPKIEKAEA